MTDTKSDVAASPEPEAVSCEVKSRPRLNQLPLGVADNVLVTVKRGDYDKLQATLDVPATLVAPFTKGQQVGTLRIALDGQQVQNVPLIALADAPQAGFFGRLWDSIMLWFHSDKKPDEKK